MSSLHALILTGGPLPSIEVALPEAQLVIAADSGGDHAENLGLKVDLIIGDFDSCSEKAIKRAAESQKFPSDKDVTDLELALAAAVEKDAASVTILTSSRGRLDHSLGNILVACSERWSDLEIELIVDDHLVKVIRSRTKLKGEPSDLLSIFALGGTAFGVTSKGLKWELDGIDLVTGSGLTISNEFVLPEAEISIEQGTIISVQAFSDKAKQKL